MTDNALYGCWQIKALYIGFARVSFKTTIELEIQNYCVKQKIDIYQTCSCK